MSRENGYIIAFICLLFALKSCIEPYQPELNKTDSEYILVVEGLITNEPGSFEITLSRSVPVDTTINSLPEQGANVFVTDDAGNHYQFYEYNPGVYRCIDENARAQTGRKYQLNITDSQGKNYESTLVEMKPTPDIKRIFWEEVSKNKFTGNEVETENGLNIYVESGESAGEASYFKWDYEETWKVEMPNYVTVDGGEGPPVQVFVTLPAEKKHCWITRSSSSILLKSLAGDESEKVDTFLVNYIPEYGDRLHYRYSILVKQYSLNKDMYDFWKNIKEFNEEIGTMYDHIPYSVYGNITCCDNENAKVLGYFNVAEVKTKRIFIDKNDHHLPTANSYGDCIYVRQPNAYYFGDGIYALSPFCADCRNFGSSIKPGFWED